LAVVAVFALPAAGAAGDPHPPLVAQNVAGGAFVPSGAVGNGPYGIAASPPATTTVVPNVSIPGLLRTGTSTATAGAASAFAKVTNISASTSWNLGVTTYTLTLSAAQAASHCTVSPLAATAAITAGKLTETAQTGSQVSTQVIDLPQAPANGQVYAYNGGTVTLNFHVKFAGLTGAILIDTPDQQLAIAVTGCSDSIRVIK
jgi:hypothetical protein